MHFQFLGIPEGAVTDDASYIDSHASMSDHVLPQPVRLSEAFTAKFAHNLKKRNLSSTAVIILTIFSHQLIL